MAAILMTGIDTAQSVAEFALLQKHKAHTKCKLHEFSLFCLDEIHPQGLIESDSV